MKNERFYFFIGWFGFIITLMISIVITKGPVTDTLSTFSLHCSDIESQEDQCEFVQSSCRGITAIYLKLYYCSGIWKQTTAIFLLLWLLVLFGAISIVASDFFCPNLQTISSKLEMSESMAGITILAFGNGSPDLFSTFSAMESGAGSLAIGELIGAAFFIVAIVSGCMGTIQPFQSQKITFMRDATYLLGSAIIMSWIVYTQQIHWYHGIILIIYYLSYVTVVMLSAYANCGISDKTSDEQKMIHQIHVVDESACLLPEEPFFKKSESGKPPRLQIPIRKPSFYSNSSEPYSQQFIHNLRSTIPGWTSPISPILVSQSTSNLPRTKSTHSTRTYRRSITPKIGFRTSIFGAIEFQEQVSSMRRGMSSQMVTSPIRHKRQFSMPDSGWRHLNNSGNGNRLRSHTSCGIQDYFTFLSDQPTLQNSTSPKLSNHPELTVPEIRLAPPANNEQIEDFEEHQNPNELQCSFYHSVREPTCSSFGHFSESESFFTTSQSHHDMTSPTASFFGHYPGSILAENQTNFSARQNEMIEEEKTTLISTLFPTLQEFCEKSTFSKVNAIIAAPLVLVFTLTLPVAELKENRLDIVLSGEASDMPAPPVNGYLSVPLSESDISANEIKPVIITGEIDAKQGWNQQLLSIQSVFSLTFAFGLAAANKVIPFSMICVGISIGSVFALLVLKFTKENEPPSWIWMTSFVGLFVALNWIFLLANQVVGLLQAIGKIFLISDSIMGITIFAFGNSAGDLVANIAIAKIGFPTMAISACYAGPLLNTVLGVGISSSYQIWKSGKPYDLNIAPSILVTLAGLIIVLISTIFVVNMNGYRITRQLGIWMISVYSLCITISFLLEFDLICYFP
ncbi:unnamed protein product [Rhizopus stolonifer]